MLSLMLSGAGFPVLCLVVEKQGKPFSIVHQSVYRFIDLVSDSNMEMLLQSSIYI